MGGSTRDIVWDTRYGQQRWREGTEEGFPLSGEKRRDGRLKERQDLV